MPFDDDDDEIAVWIVPKIDDAAADEAEQKLKDKFKDVAPDLGKGLFDALGDSGALDQLGTKFGSIIKEPLQGIADDFGVDIDSAINKALKGDKGGALDDVVGQLGTKLGSTLKDPLHDIADNFGVHLDDVLKQALSGDTGGALDTAMGQLGTKFGSILGDGFKDLTGVDLSGLTDQIKPLTDVVNSLKGGDFGGVLQGANTLTGGALQPLSDMHDQVKQTIGDTKELVEEFAVGDLGSRAAPLLTEAASPVVAAMLSTGPVEDQLNKIPWDPTTRRAPWLGRQLVRCAIPPRRRRCHAPESDRPSRVLRQESKLCRSRIGKRSTTREFYRPTL